MHRARDRRTAGRTVTCAGVAVLVLAAAAPAAAGDDETAAAAKVIGPLVGDDACANCHALEIEAWQQTRHFATFKDRHRSDRAKEILGNVGERSMKRSSACRQCHYTSVLKADKLRASWGVTCESCHGPARDWNAVHNKPGGDASAEALVWGHGKDEAAAARRTRLDAAAAKGMLHSDKLYDIASNCFGCHTVPNEALVNKGKHKAGSEFELVAWSQGEIRHNFASSDGAPDSPSNRPATAERKRRMYVVGAVVDLERSVRNLASVAEPGGAFHTAMIERVNTARARLAQVLDKVELAELAPAVKAIPATVDADTKLGAELADALGAAGRKFAAGRDGSGLAAIDSLLPTEMRGEVHQP